MSANAPNEQSYAGSMSLPDAGSRFNLTDFIVRQVINKVATLQLVQVQAVHVPETLDGTGTVDVRIMVGQIDGDGNITPHGTIFGLPYFRLQGGTSAFILDPAEGDIGLAAVCARDISTVKATRAPAAPGSFRKYDWADGLYIGGFLNGIPQQYIQMLAGGSGINIISPTAIVGDAPTFTVNASTSVTVTSPQVTVVSDNVSLGAEGGPAVARVGDTVDCPGGPGTITSGSDKVTAA